MVPIDLLRRFTRHGKVDRMIHSATVQHASKQKVVASNDSLHPLQWSLDKSNKLGYNNTPSMLETQMKDTAIQPEAGY